MSFLAIDFEASCLPRHGRSYPIEVAIADGARAHSWLIQPQPEWASWDWSAEAESLHGIKREELMSGGRPAQEVFGAMLEIMEGRRLVADSELDQYWLDMLADAAGQPRLHICPVAAILDELELSASEIYVARTLIADCGVTRHRAAPDALWLSRILAMLQCSHPHAEAA